LKNFPDIYWKIKKGKVLRREVAIFMAWALLKGKTDKMYGGK